MLRYDLLLKAVLKETPEDHDDISTIPEVLEVIKDLGKTVDHSIKTAERKVELWRYNRNLVWRPGEEIVSAHIPIFYIAIKFALEGYGFTG